MQVSDIAFGLLLIIILSWTMMIALNQSNMAVVINNISASQKTIIPDSELCSEIQGFSLMQEEEIGFEEYTIVPIISEARQLVLCVYKKHLLAN